MSRKHALIIGNNEYQDPTLARLVTPGEDVNDLAAVLRAPDIGEFDEVTALVNELSANVRLEIESFFAEKKLDDLLLMYFSGHGVRDDHGQLYLAVKDTRHDRLRATAIPAAFVTEGMDHTRSRRQVLILDCCHSGAFAQGAKGVTGESVGIKTAFEGRGYGRVVLTATDATQYAWEGDQVIGEAENSVFTHYMIDGLKTGAADTDGDGQITLDELYDYVYEQVVSKTPKQTPGKWSYKQQGEIVIAKNPHPIVKRATLPADLQQATESPFAGVREGAIRELERLLNGSLPGLSQAAREALQRLADDDSRRVAGAASDVLKACAEAAAAREREKTEAERLAAQKAEAERIAREKAEPERLAQKLAESERAAREKAQQERLAQEKAEQEHLAKAKAEAERLAAQKAEADRLAIEKAEQERLAKEKAEAERLAAQKAEAERIAREKTEQERLAKAKAEAERLAAQKTKEERIARQKAEQERFALKKTEAERAVREKAEQERLAKEKAEVERLTRQKAQQEQQAKEKPKDRAESRVKAQALPRLLWILGLGAVLLACCVITGSLLLSGLSAPAATSTSAPAATAGLTACPKATDATQAQVPANPKSITMALPLEIDNVVAEYSNMTYAIWLSQMVGAGLAKWDDKSNFIPELAQEIPTADNGGVSKDGLTITWKLKPCIFWSDGQPITSKDVVFLWQSENDPKNAPSSRYGPWRRGRRRRGASVAAPRRRRSSP